jgi:hypothetical protein
MFGGLAPTEAVWKRLSHREPPSGSVLRIEIVASSIARRSESRSVARAPVEEGEDGHEDRPWESKLDGDLMGDADRVFDRREPEG